MSDWPDLDRDFVDPWMLPAECEHWHWFYTVDWHALCYECGKALAY